MSAHAGLERAGGWECVDKMLREARKNGLLLEVVIAFGEARFEKSSVRESVAHARKEWDI